MFIGGVEYSREAAIHKYLYLVKHVASRIATGLPKHVELDDLVNDGILGLIDAIEKYDDARGVKFETYAVTRINGAIIDALRSLDWVPRTVRQRTREVERAQRELEVQLGRSPSSAEVADKLQMTPEEFARVMQRVRGASLLSLEERLPGARGTDIALSETLRDESADVIGDVERRDTRAALVAVVESLPPQERSVIGRYYFGGQSLKEIGAALGVSESRVSQVHGRAVKRLREGLRGW
jgi:RNA polymerase sigma factor for flagellar operon FliA